MLSDDDSKKFKQDFYKRICASKLASGKAPSIAPATNKRKKVKSEKWIEKESIDQDNIVNEEHLKRKLSVDETARDSKRPMLETSSSVEVINLSEDGEETDLERAGRFPPEWVRIPAELATLPEAPVFLPWPA